MIMRVKEIKKEAKDRFALNRYHAMLIYGVVFTIALNIAVLTTALCLLNVWAVWYGVFLIFMFLLMLAPFGYSMAGFYIRLYRFEKIDAFHVFDGFNKYNLERVIILRLLSFALWLCFTVLLIVPGIIFKIRTCVATYFLRANPDMKPKDALKASNKVMKGHCWKFFCLQMSFIGWFIMGVLTCGFGFIWVMPYFNTSKVVFYKRELEGDTKVYRNPLDLKQNEKKSAPQTVAQIADGVENVHSETVINNPDSRQTIVKEEPEQTVQYVSTEQVQESHHHAEIRAEEIIENASIAEIDIAEVTLPEEPQSRQNIEQAEISDYSAPEHGETERRSGNAESISARERPSETVYNSRLNRVSSRALGGGRVVMDENGQRIVPRPTAQREYVRERKTDERRAVGERRERVRPERVSARGERERTFGERRRGDENIDNKIGEDGK